MRTSRRGIGLCGLLAARAALVPINPGLARVVGRGNRGFASSSGAGAQGAAGAGGGWRGAGAALPPPPKSIPATVTFGVVAGEDRGDDPMDPPVTRTDDLFWLRDDKRQDPEVLAHLRGENAHTEGATAHLAGARRRLYAELKGHVQETDSTAPVPHGPWEYFCRTVEGLSYKLWCRRPRSGSGAAAGAGEELLLDENELAKPHAFFSVGEVEVSPSHRLLAYSADTNGYETFSVRVLDLDSGALLEDELHETDGSVAWGAGDEHLYYVRFDSAHRPHQLWRHSLGTPSSSDLLLHTEPDPRFNLHIHKAASGHFLFVAAESSETAEVHALRLVEPDGEGGAETAERKEDAGAGQGPADRVVTRETAPALRCVAPRRFGVLYSVEHRCGELLILTNDRGMKNFGLMVAHEDSATAEEWEAVPGVPYDPEVNLEGLRATREGVGLFGRRGGLTACWVMEGVQGGRPVREATGLHHLSLPEPASQVGPAPSRNFHSPELRLSYSSMVTPPSTLAYDFASKKMRTVKQLQVPGYDPSLYACARLSAPSRDGTPIPLSLVYRKGAYDPSVGGPLLLYGYGSYGICMEPSFSALRLPLLDRGVGYVIAHVRGGGEMGRAWYEEEGKYLAKMNTFFDFVDCAKYLQESSMTTPSQLAITGRSAGGLLMGAALNIAPELFGCCVAGVPFVDVMVSMCDPSIPLTTGEWEEWGNPNSAKYHDYMLSYSPMENIRPAAYPPLLVTAGLYDPRVAYWEPAKWVARLRKARTNSAPLLLKMDLETGHFSASDRYKYLEQTAFEYAFMLDVLGLLAEEESA